MTTHNNREDDGLAKRVLERIDSERLAPRPRWEFIAKSYFFWTLGALAVVLGALAVAATLFEITNVDWRLSVATHSSPLSFFLATAPFFWVIALALFILIGYVNVRRTNHGYRYSLTIIALGAVLTSLALGSGLYTAGLGRAIEEVIGDHPPFYRPILFAERSWWLAPEKGLLGGQIVSATPGDAFFVIHDFTGRTWEVDGSDLHTPDLETIARGGIVRIVGLPVSATSSAFHACFVFPWETHGDLHNGQLPPPTTATPPDKGMAATSTQSDLCKDIHPYQQLRSIDDVGL